MSFGTNTTPSNSTGLAIAEETTFKTLPGTPEWRELEPNSYSDFGGDITTVARSPIKQDRQRKKGVVTDLVASAAFDMDFTQKTPYNLLDGFMFADWREKDNDTVTSVSGTAYTVGAGATAYAVGDLLFAENHATAGNDGFKEITATTGTTLAVAGLTAEASPPATAKVTRVGHRAATADITVTVSGSTATLGSTVLDFTDLGMIPGEWIYIGGDATINQFATAATNGWYRVKTIAAGSILVDRIPDNAATDTGTGKEIDIYLGHVLKNESDPANIQCKSYTIERKLNATAYQYVIGAAPNVFDLNLPTAEKVETSLSYVAADSLGETSQRSGNRTTLPEEDGFNTTSNVTRLRMFNDDTDAALYTFVQEAKINIDNGISGNKAIGTLGAFDMAFGDFVVTGSVTAYFTDITAVQAVRNNNAVSLDFTLITKNQGWIMDIPYLSMGDGRPNVEKDQAITIPLNIEGAAHPDFNHTMLVGFFTYLPDLAE